MSRNDLLEKSGDQILELLQIQMESELSTIKSCYEKFKVCKSCMNI